MGLEPPSHKVAGRMANQYIGVYLRFVDFDQDQNSVVHGTVLRNDDLSRIFLSIFNRPRRSRHTAYAVWKINDAR